MTLFALMIPLLIVVVAFTMTMTARSNELRGELDEELALLAAESGIDDAIYRGRTGTLDGTKYTKNLGLGQSFEVDPTYLKADGNDNDGDTDIDEDDEDVYQVIVTGTYRQTQRRIAAYLGPVPTLPTIKAAVVIHDPSVTITLQGTSLIDGDDINIDGSVGSGPDMPGIAIAPPGTVAYLDSQLTGSEPNRVQGVGASPCLGTASSIDLATLVPQIQNIADLILTSTLYASFTFGDASAGTAKITYRNGDVTFTGICRGAGILVVTGNLTMVGTFRFDGVIIVLGQVVNSAGTAQVYGGIVQGPAGGVLTIRGTSDLRYSSEAIELANSVSGRYVSFMGWQELAR